MKYKAFFFKENILFYTIKNIKRSKMNEEFDSIQLIENKVIQITRPVYNQKQFDQEFLLNKNKHENKSFRCKQIIKSFDPSRLLSVFTILNLITEYNFKNDLIPDILSGFTVGIMHIPAVYNFKLI